MENCRQNLVIIIMIRAVIIIRKKRIEIIRSTRRIRMRKRNRKRRLRIRIRIRTRTRTRRIKRGTGITKRKRIILAPFRLPSA
jgi:hypothetical protein